MCVCVCVCVWEGVGGVMGGCGMGEYVHVCVYVWVEGEHLCVYMYVHVHNLCVCTCLLDVVLAKCLQSSG